MKISEILKNGKINISCEMFPPKVGSELDKVNEIVDEIAELSPSFMSVTCGANGSNAGQNVAVADRIQNNCNVTALAHMTCVMAQNVDIDEQIDILKERNIENILALRGDLPNDGFKLSDDFAHASDLIKRIKQRGDFCVGGACYPEGHPESPSVNADIEALKIKADCGFEFFTTQMFFDNNILYNFMYKMLRAGIDVPVIAGIMPLTNAVQAKRICSVSGTPIPSRFKMIVDKFSDDPKGMKQAGIIYACEQIVDLVANGVTNIHIYTMNKPDIAKKIFENLSDIIK